jgi:hypothetical protein
MSMKKAYTPTEFAALFGKEKTWTYRQLYKGRIEGITKYGRLMIPVREADRIGADSAIYRGRKKKVVPTPHVEVAPQSCTPRGNSQWKNWVASGGCRKTARPKVGAKHRPVPGGKRA